LDSTPSVEFKKGGNDMTKPRLFLLCLILCFFGCITIIEGHLYAANSSATFSFSGDKTVFSHQSIVIPNHETIDHVVEIGGDVTLSGSVHEIIVIGGNLHIKRTAQIRDLVLVIGGSITQEPGAKVTDELFHLAFDHQMANNLLVTSSFLFGWWFFRLSFSLLLFILPIGAALLAKHRIDPFMSRIRLELKRTILIGVATSLLLLSIAFLLIISVIGIPLLIILALLLISFGIICLTAVAMMIGEQISLTAGREKWLIVAVGSAILTSVINFPLLGWILLLGLHWLSLGLMTVWLWEKRSRLIKPKN
jgi:hypothetical protein